MNLNIGSRHTVEIQRVAHGGHCVGRIGEVVCFVRHTLPGETVEVEITSLGKQNKFVFADAVEVKVPSPHRIDPVCKFAGSCGGCDWQHVEFSYQQILKSEVLKEQLVRLGKLSQDHPILQNLKVSSFPGDSSGLRYRTRIEYQTDSRGRLGLRKHSSNDVIAVDHCQVALEAITGDGFSNVPWAANAEIRVVASSTGEVVKIAESDEAEYRILEKVGNFNYQVNAKSFWQAHRLAPAMFVETMKSMMELNAGQHVLELYCGSGLFTLPIAEAVGPGGRIEAVESDLKAVTSLKRNTRQFSNVNIHALGAEKWFKVSKVKKLDAVLLDPPRTGAGEFIVKNISKLNPSKVLYVACDPASLARDVATFASAGYELAAIRAFDAFGQTQHLETFALFVPSKIRVN